jgi:hypothetical protein
MSIPEDVKDKLDSDPAWAVQHEDIVRIMDETRKEKPWSRYMIQQHLDGDPAKKTVQDRLDELIELGVLDKYEYSVQTLYDLAYDPIVTDGGRLKDTSLIELVTLRNRTGVRDLGTGGIFMSLAFFGYGFLSEVTELSSTVDMFGNFYIDAGIVLYLFALALIFSVRIMQRLDPWLPRQDASN